MKIFYVLFATHSRPSASGVYRFGDQYFEVQEELEAEAAAANGCSRGGGEYYDSDGVCCYGEEEGLFGDEEDFEEEEDVDVGAFVAGDEDEELLAAEARSHRGGGGICLEGDDVEEEALLVMQVKHMKACMMHKNNKSNDFFTRIPRESVSRGAPPTLKRSTRETQSERSSFGVCSVIADY